MNVNLSALVPESKFDVEKAAALVQLGFPAVEPVLPQVLEWVQDLNWPVAGVLVPFLAEIGAPLGPYVRAVLAGDDDGWKYCLLQAVVVPSLPLARALRPELGRIAAHPAPGELKEELDQLAGEILKVIDENTAGT